ncbi:MAG: hypothetical protein ISR82_04805 [Candidatus Marinimicrobia bacterium]|nr:hypothetical protein [Candidatus Neomarinimicrobiota bacterium]MBL7010520.1 hypothetical protein [Candidatus Neomarinimicrobiota bacterium]MBL7030859.1 hypothetical protein [Candidatus Neomarinimicrobiota bacterium]
MRILLLWAVMPCFIASILWAGEITGRVIYIGELPKLRSLIMDTDSVCAASNQKAVLEESLIVDTDGNLANVIVYLTGITFYGNPPTTPAILDQKNCLYSPHVFAVMAGQRLDILNSDTTMHNVHAHPKINKEFNRGMPKSRKKMSHIFPKPEDVFEITCDVHPWMKSYLRVFDHPYFAVTGTDGTFNISNVPDGTYEIVAWQEKFGNKRTLTQSISVKDGKSIANFSFERPKKKKK